MSSPESKRSPRTARAFLLSVVAVLQDDGIVDEDWHVAHEVAIATVKAASGDRYNISIHKIAGEGIAPTGPRPKVKFGKKS